MYSKYYFIVLSGCLLPLAFPPYNIWIMAFIAPLCLLYIWREANPKQAFAWGWLYGLGYYSFGFVWLKDCIMEFAGLPQAAALLLSFVLVNSFSFYLAILGYALKRASLQYSAQLLLLAFPAGWVLMEWAKTRLFTGFPWLNLSYSQLSTPLKYYAPIIGGYGISWLVILTASLLYLILQKKTKAIFKVAATLLLASIWLSGIALKYVSWAEIDSRAHTVSLVQPNIKARAKQTEFINHWQIYGPLTERTFGSDLVIWPETSIPFEIGSLYEYVNFLDQMAKKHNFALVLGAVEEVPGINANKPSDKRFYNSLKVLGTTQAVYHKQRLVPFAEYLPYDKLLRKPIEKLGFNFSLLKLGPSNQNALDLKFSKILPLICYEISYADSVSAKMKTSSANVIVNISEDGWFGKPVARYQHLDMARMRALETGRYVLRSSTSGISAIIDEKGDIISQARPFSAEVIRGSFYNAKGFTPWLKLGTNKFMAIMGFLILLSVALGRCGEIGRHTIFRW